MTKYITKVIKNTIFYHHIEQNELSYAYHDAIISVLDLLWHKIEINAFLSFYLTLFLKWWVRNHQPWYISLINFPFRPHHTLQNDCQNKKNKKTNQNPHLHPNNHRPGTIPHHHTTTYLFTTAYDAPKYL